MNNLEIRIFVTSLLLVELLDETYGDTRYKHKLKYHIRELTKLLEKLNNIVINDDELMGYLSDVGNTLEEAVNSIEYVDEQ